MLADKAYSVPVVLQNNWEAVKALALDTSTVQHQPPTSPSHDSQSAAQVSDCAGMLAGTM